MKDIHPSSTRDFNEYIWGAFVRHLDYLFANFNEEPEVAQGSKIEIFTAMLLTASHCGGRR
jgi:hypothetical protein